MFHDGVRQNEQALHHQRGHAPSSMLTPRRIPAAPLALPQPVPHRPLLGSLLLCRLLLFNGPLPPHL